ncbi:ataxin-7-like protein 3 [Actinia tenebrosa]|uniref:SAGA-associated factor 11 homolog n=1 Tax=Actinia tenebrosa TaxID=6105 RepID=A0A6P8HZV3_ACTTE|nr:ataxin-7-like protein 3 [Actinia tenebrosa]
MASKKMVTAGHISGTDNPDIREHSSPEADIVYEIIDDVVLGLCFEMHKAIKMGTFGVEDGDGETAKQYDVVDVEGLDVFGQVPLKKPLECICPNCQRNMAASRFAPHLEKCMGMGRNSSRIASRRLATSGKLMEEDDDDSYFDDDWTWNNDKKPGRKNKREKPGNSPRRAKAPRKNGEAGTPRPATPSSVNSGEMPATRGPTVAAFEALSIDEKKTLLLQTCGVISEHTGRMCTRSQRCPQHSDDQRKSVRQLMLGQQPTTDASTTSTTRLRPDGSSYDADDVIDVDSYEDGDGPLLRDNLSRLSWEEESNASTGDDNSPAAFGSAALTKKKRKKKAKHKRRLR